jgi:hypothetical protein
VVDILGVDADNLGCRGKVELEVYGQMFDVQSLIRWNDLFANNASTYIFPMPLSPVCRLQLCA